MEVVIKEDMSVHRHMFQTSDFNTVAQTPPIYLLVYKLPSDPPICPPTPI